MVEIDSVPVVITPLEEVFPHGLAWEMVLPPCLGLASLEGRVRGRFHSGSLVR